MKKLDIILQDALLGNNLISETDLHAHMNEARSMGHSLKEYLISKSILTEKQILIALSQKLKTEFITFSDLEIDKAVLEKVPTKFAWYYKILPVRASNNLLTVATANPLDVNIQDELRVHLKLDIDFVLGEEHLLLEALKKNYGLASETIDRILTKDPTQTSKSIDNGQWIEDLEQKTEDPTVSNLVNQIILEAYKKRATDIHIEPYRNKVRFRYRIDGALVDANLPGEVKVFLPKILSRIKILANLSITEKRLPQDGSAVVKTQDQNLDLRISTMPTPRGESIVIRILPTKVMLFSLEKLGFNNKSVNYFRKIIKKPHGIIFITGPTGSGKTTTLYACLNEINSSKRKIITIEDPVEYEMDGITQVQVNPKVQFSFATGLRSILRHDPDIIMVGEVRDPETAEIAIKTALTGHLVFSTLHTNDAASGITRLIDMGTEPYLVASSVEAFIAQRLIRVICEKCKVEDKEPMPGVKKEIVKSLGLIDDEGVRIYKGQGCDHCNNTGYYGRIAVYEILILNDSIRAAILEKPRSDYIKKIAMREGLKTLRQNGWQAVLDGLTTPDEVLNVTIKDEYIEEKVTFNPEEDISNAESPNTFADFGFHGGIKKNKSYSRNEYRERIYPRATQPIPVKYTVVRKNPGDDGSLVPEGEQHVAQCRDISAGGVRFRSDKVLDLGSILKIEIRLTGSLEEINCMARVCRVKEKNKEDGVIYNVATYFLDISSEDRQKINRYIDQKLQEEKQIEI